MSTPSSAAGSDVGLEHVAAHDLDGIPDAGRELLRPAREAAHAGAAHLERASSRPPM